jgi:hypothetical protein
MCVFLYIMCTKNVLIKIAKICKKYVTNFAIFSAFLQNWINPLIAELNPVCHLLALLGAHHILHVSRIRVNSVMVRHHK